MTEDNNRSHSTPPATSSVSDPPVSATSKRIEDLLLDDDEAPRTTFRDLADQEVKSGKSTGSSLRWPLVVFALLIVAIVVVVVGWYQFADSLTGQQGVAEQGHVEKRMAAPERPQPQEAVQQATAHATQGDDRAVTELGQVGSGVAADVVTKGAAAATADETAVPLSDLATTPAVVAGDDAIETVLIAAEVVVSQEQMVAAESPGTMATEPVYRVLVGPFIGQRDLERAAALLRERGFQPQQQHGSGTVDMIRLLEGIYPLAQAQQRLEEVRKEFSSAFLLPDGGRWALYIGSFSDRDRARRQQRELAERQIQVAPVDSQLTMEGPLLVVVRNSLNAAEEVAAEVNAGGLRARIEIER